MKSHSLLAPSSAFRRALCPGSRALEAEMPESVSESSKEGNLAHEIAAQMFEDKSLLDRASTEMEKYCRDYVNYVKRHVLKPYVEKTLDMPNIHESCYGTPDAFGMSEGCELHVFDFKYGFKPVGAFENLQLIAYASGALDKLGIRSNSKNITLHIFQPRDFKNPVKEWYLFFDEFLEYERKLIKSENESLKTDAPLIPGEGCSYCKARGVCPALKKRTGEIIKEDAMLTLNLSNEELAEELKELKRNKEIMESRITGLEEQVKYKLSQGENVPYFKLGNVDSRERWIIDSCLIKKLGEAYGVDLFKHEPITPLQAIKAGVPWDAVEWVIEKPQGAVKLIEIKEKDIKQIFKK